MRLTGSSRRAVIRSRDGRQHYTIGHFDPNEGSLNDCVEFLGPVMPGEIDEIKRVYGLRTDAKIMRICGKISTNDGRLVYWGRLTPDPRVALVQTDIDLCSGVMRLISSEIKRQDKMVEDVYPIICRFQPTDSQRKCLGLTDLTPKDDSD